ncbi:MAG: hypothetical protein FWC09_04715 [Lachnospiraceae bacterium]|nr:hypothetical protein [Lachnospiraceae bacterium]
MIKFSKCKAIVGMSLALIIGLSSPMIADACMNRNAADSSFFNDNRKVLGDGVRLRDAPDGETTLGLMYKTDTVRLCKTIVPGEGLHWSHVWRTTVQSTKGYMHYQYYEHY